MTTNSITFDQVKEKVIELALKSPENVYIGEREECFYLQGSCTDGSIGCIWGQALKSLGIKEEELEKLDGKGILAGEVLILLGIKASTSEKYWATTVQDLQDNKTPWGLAIEKANAHCDLRR